MIGSYSVRWPGSHEKQAIAEMLNNYDSEHWNKCNELMRCLIMRQANKLSVFLPVYLVDEILQNAMVSVIINLHHFRSESKLTTWLTKIAYTRTIDALRLHSQTNRRNSPLNNLIEGEENEDIFYGNEIPATIEDESVVHEDLREALAEISIYIGSHAKSVRNRKIVQMVLFEGHRLEKTAQEVGVSSAVVSYVIRTLQRHLQEKFRT